MYILYTKTCCSGNGMDSTVYNSGLNYERRKCLDSPDACSECIEAGKIKCAGCVQKKIWSNNFNELASIMPIDETNPKNRDGTVNRIKPTLSTLYNSKSNTLLIGDYEIKSFIDRYERNKRAQIYASLSANSR